MNLVDLVKDQLGSNVLTRLAETLGASPDNTRTAMNAAVPTLLTAFGSVVSTHDGARDLAAAVGSLDDRVLENLPQSLSGGGRVWSQSRRHWDEAPGLAPRGPYPLQPRQCLGPLHRHG